VLDPGIQSAIDSVPTGAWAVGVSGGADSVALLSLLRTRADLKLVVAHLDHETRAGASAADAAFVRDLCAAWNIPLVAATFSAIAPTLSPVVKNLSARWRAARISLYREVVSAHDLRGVMLAHHADDQAETVFHRLLRSTRPSGVSGMAASTRLSGLNVLRPLLGVRRQTLREYLRTSGQSWREDESNLSSRYLRNRIRRLLTARPSLIEPLLELGEGCRELRAWLDSSAPTLRELFRLREVHALPPVLAEHALARWLRTHGGCDADAAAVRRLWEMANDAASPARQHFPGGVLVQRRAGWISLDNHK
jgi:tRNA(Ile)-lysidine synthetase-like protein